MSAAASSPPPMRPGRDEDGQAVDGVGGQECTGERWAGLEQHGRETKVAQEVQCRIDVNASGGGGCAGEHLGTGLLEADERGRAARLVS